MFIEPMLASTVTEKKRATLSDKSGYVLEPKHDGMRAIISKHDGVVKIYSRVGLEYQEHLPALVAELADLPDNTVLDGELMVIKSRALIGATLVAVADFNQTMRIMGSGCEKAIARQEETKIRFCAFDIIEIEGVSLVDEPFSTRVKLLSDVLTGEFPSIFQNTVMEEWDDSTIDDLWKAGIEGAILKNTNSVYIPGKRRANTWYKVKSELTADVVVVGFTEANEGKTGKFAGKIGAIRFGAYTSDGVLVEIGQCSGMNDAERDRWTEIRDSGELDYPAEPSRVIEVKYNDLVGSGEYGTPRHPQFKTERVDKRADDCRMEQFRM